MPPLTGYAWGMTRTITANELRKHLADLDEKSRDIDAERRVYLRLLAIIDNSPEDGGQHASASWYQSPSPLNSSPHSEAPASASPRPKPTEAIFQLVRQEPGLTPTQIADVLAGKVESNAKDVRNVIRTTVAKLASEGLLEKDSENRMTISESARVLNKWRELEDRRRS